MHYQLNSALNKLKTNKTNYSISALYYIAKSAFYKCTHIYCIYMNIYNTDIYSHGDTLSPPFVESLAFITHTFNLI